MWYVEFEVTDEFCGLRGTRKTKFRYVYPEDVDIGQIIADLKLGRDLIELKVSRGSPRLIEEASETLADK